MLRKGKERKGKSWRLDERKGKRERGREGSLFLMYTVQTTGLISYKLWGGSF